MLRMNNDLMRFRNEIRRNLMNNAYELADDGRILVPSMGAFIGGVFTTSINGQDVRTHPNLFVTEGRNHVLSVVCKGAAQVTTWRIAPFEGNVTPDATWTAATFKDTATEFTSYDETTRREWVEGTVSGGAVSNTGDRAIFTISSGVTNKDLYGAALISASAKSATTGTLLAAGLFTSNDEPSPRRVNAADEFGIGYDLSLLSE
jgi:hypothetical protein